MSIFVPNPSQTRGRAIRTEQITVRKLNELSFYSNTQKMCETKPTNAGLFSGRRHFKLKWKYFHISDCTFHLDICLKWKKRELCALKINNFVILSSVWLTLRLAAADCVQCGGRRPVKWDVSPSIRERWPPCAWDEWMAAATFGSAACQPLQRSSSPLLWVNGAGSEFIWIIARTGNALVLGESSRKKRVPNFNGNCCKRHLEASLSSSLHWWGPLSLLCLTKRCILWTLCWEIMGALIGCLSFRECVRPSVSLWKDWREMWLWHLEGQCDEN